MFKLFAQRNGEDGLYSNQVDPNETVIHILPVRKI